MDTCGVLTYVGYVSENMRQWEKFRELKKLVGKYLFMTDPIADMLTRIRNALAAKKADVLIPASKIKLGIADILIKEGFIKEVQQEQDQGGSLKITLKYDASGAPAIEGLKRVSKPGQRIYTSATNIYRVKQGLGISIVSTSMGLMTDSAARRDKTGGEVLCEIW